MFLSNLSRVRFVNRFLILFILTFCSFGLSQAQPLSGTKIINNSGAGDYDSISDAIDDLIAKGGVDGPLVFEIVDGTYNEQVIITSIPGSGPVNTITFQPQSGTPCGVTWTFSATGPGNNWVVKLDGADYITFKNICFAAIGTNFAIVFEILGGAHNNTITNCELNSVVPTSSSADFTVINATDRNDNLTLTDNTLNDGYNGVEISATSNDHATGTVIKNNTIKNQENHSIHLAYQDSPIVEGNKITSPAPSVGSYRGIYLLQCDEKIRIIKNKLLMDNGISILAFNCAGTSSMKGLIANNFLLSKGSSTGNLVDISSTTTYCDIVFNSMLNTGNASACMVIGSQTSNITVMNNLAINESAGLAYDVPTAAAITASDYNDFYTTGSNLARWDGTNYSNLSDLQTASGMDAHSVSKSVNFVDAANADLHLTGASLGDTDLIATPVTSVVTDDYDGESRNAFLPYMGADENPQDPLPVELTSFTANAIKNTVVLNWITASETNNFGFEVQRRGDTEVWAKIAFIEGHGTTNEPQFYRFTDNEIQIGRYGYRLRQIDTNGDFTFSQVLSVEIISPNNFHLSQNYPNPFNPETVIQYQLKTSSEVEISIFNSLGRKIRTLVNETKDAGEHQIQWDGKNAAGKIVASGTYYYTLKIDGKTLFTKPMLLLK